MATVSQEWSIIDIARAAGHYLGPRRDKGRDEHGIECRNCRGNALVNPKKGLWNCFHCGAGGSAEALAKALNAPDYVSVAAEPRREKRPPKKDVVATWGRLREREPIAEAYLRGRSFDPEWDVARKHIRYGALPGKPQVAARLYDIEGTHVGIGFRSARSLVPENEPRFRAHGTGGYYLDPTAVRSSDIVVVAEGMLDSFVAQAAAPPGAAVLALRSTSVSLDDIETLARGHRGEWWIAVDADEAGVRAARSISRILTTEGVPHLWLDMSDGDVADIAARLRAESVATGALWAELERRAKDAAEEEAAEAADDYEADLPAYATGVPVALIHEVRAVKLAAHERRREGGRADRGARASVALLALRIWGVLAWQSRLGEAAPTTRQLRLAKYMAKQAKDVRRATKWLKEHFPQFTVKGSPPAYQLGKWGEREVVRAPWQLVALSAVTDVDRYVMFALLARLPARNAVYRYGAVPRAGLAAYLGMSPRRLSKSLRRLEDAGFVALERERVQVACDRCAWGQSSGYALIRCPRRGRRAADSPATYGPWRGEV